VAKKHNATAVGAMELALWLKSKGVEKIAACNIGGSYRHEDVTITLTEARHSSGIQDEDGKFVYGAVPVGFVIAIDNGPVIYNTGDTGLFSDIQLIRDFHQPEFIMLPIGDHYTMGPKAAALAIKFSGAQEVLPLHWGTLPELVGTPVELEKQLAAIGLSAVQVHKINPGDTIR
jgi:L-ascorbate metabolism protein UlaG (beta-lactamase superfamily)